VLTVKLITMKWLNRLDGTRRAASGMEWRIWRKLPLIALVGTLLPAVLWLVCEWTLDPQSNAEHARWLLTGGYVALGAVIFHWTMVLTVGIGCAVVMVMKGPGYVADAYPLSHSDRPSSKNREETKL
jgi:hypothetical protein